MFTAILDGFKSAFTWQMVGQTIGQLVIVIAFIVLCVGILALLRD